MKILVDSPNLQKKSNSTKLKLKSRIMIFNTNAWLTGNRSIKIYYHYKIQLTNNEVDRLQDQWWKMQNKRTAQSGKSVYARARVCSEISRVKSGDHVIFVVRVLRRLAIAIFIWTASCIGNHYWLFTIV